MKNQRQTLSGSIFWIDNIRMSIRFLQCIVKMQNILQDNNVSLVDNIALKREIIKSLSIHKRDVEMEREDLDEIVDEVITLLYESDFDEDHLIQRIKDSTLCLDEDLIDICTVILEEIGNNIIETGTYITPGSSSDPQNPESAIEYALLGSVDHNVHVEAIITEENLLDPRLFNIPTDKDPSPSIFTVDNITYDCSTPFTQQMLRLEELGRINISQATSDNRFTAIDIPQPHTDGFPILADLYDFMNNINTGNLGQKPTKEANTSDPNPWADKISTEIDPPDFTNGVAEGRAPGTYGAHQKWDDQTPDVLTITCQTGAITNNGCRDTLQMHGYTAGEFGPGGLYHKALNSMTESGTTNGIPPTFHFGLPNQKKESLWTFDGTFPPKLLMSRYNDPHIMRHYNFLPINPTKNRGFGLHTISTHEHNGTNNSVSDGFAQSFFFPGEYYDYHYAMTLAGYTSINKDAIDPRAARPEDWEYDNGEIVIKNGKRIPLSNTQIAGDWKETMSTHWFHDHMLDYTAQNVYKGNAAMMNYYSALDRGNEEIDDGVNLRLPSGTELSWGNRDYDVNLIVSDKAWDNEGQLWFNPFNTNGFLGDRMLVNWVLEPYFEVRARRYRFRILNASVSRFMKYAFVVQRSGISGQMQGPIGSNVSYDRVPFWMIANCGNLLMHAIKFDGTNGTTSGVLPVQAIAERFDIIIDFADFEAGDKLYMVNVLEHFNGKRPNKEIALENILNGTYSGDPCVMQFLEFRVMEYTDTDLSIHPQYYEVGKRPMIPIEPLNEGDIRNAIQRNFNFVNKFGTTDEWAIETDGGQDFQMDPRRLSAAPRTNALELWTLNNGAPTWAHNIHIHFTEGKIILRDGQLPPIWEQFARKDVYRVGGNVDSSESVVIALKFFDSKGDTYMMHCHNTQHEDHAMLLRYDINGECCVKTLPCPLPTWEGVVFMETKTLPTFKSGMLPDNMFYVRPEKMLLKLRQIDNIVPDVETGSYFVNGLGKSLQLDE